MLWYKSLLSFRWPELVMILPSAPPRFTFMFFHVFVRRQFALQYWLALYRTLGMTSNGFLQRSHNFCHTIVPATKSFGRRVAIR